MNLDWKSIRPLSGSRDKGFEELCAQLARAETPPGAQFERKGTPDAGVECYAILNDGPEWAWQAKYFDTLGNSQWPQINKSVKAAIEKHPRLVRYFICIPLDRPDARLEGKKSAKDKWDEQVDKWTRLAADKGMSVEFVYWGSHELLERLARPEHVGRIRFWFDVRGFDAAWFKARLNEALRTAGPRYTPEIHVDLPIASEFEAFGRTDRFFDRDKVRARAIRQELRSLNYSTKDIGEAVGGAFATVSANIQAVLTSISAIKKQPTGPLPFKDIAEQVRTSEQAAEELSQLLYKSEREFEKRGGPASEKTPQTSYQRNPFRDLQARLFRLTSELREARESFDHSDHVAGNNLLLIFGKAGTGKTHLLCDVAHQRIADGCPTVLLMGQRFVSNDAPWLQALQQLDLADISVEKFVGALEAAAQAANSRALLMVDALNEGTGRTIWPNHLAAFLAHIERSPWIGVVLAIRSPYEEIILPEDIWERAVKLTHGGFTEHEYDATKTFFIHYGLELPSTPLLAPEFRHPLFLKTLCRGLNARGESRLPRGFQGITAIFDLYLSAVNERLASNLDFDKRTPLVRQTLEAFTEAIIDSGKPWLNLSKAQEIVNSFLPGRGYKQSLYRGLVTEGVLIEEVSLRQDVTEEIVFLSYERFSDHLIAKTLLDRHLNVDDPAAAFAQEGDLAFICDEQRYISPGLLEALCIQIPERIGQELPTVAPNCTRQWKLGDAFRQSLIWRTYAAFSEDTRQLLNELCCSERDFDDSLDVLLTVATLPDHPFNARFLDQRLRRDAMPDRDAWWSVYLHHVWGTHGTVDRLVDWASLVDSSTSVDEEAVNLCAITLSWMFTTSNRFLRDRATKALVSLLTDRLDAAVRLVEHFADVDDPYVVERVYAVAYGVAMRCHDPVTVGALAQGVYNCVFATDSPPPHILLRDYARGVIERAFYIGAEIDVTPECIRPPYKSIWPRIPSEKDIESLRSNWSKGTHHDDELVCSRHQIFSSVTSGDFAHYVIGTNSSTTSRCWLSLTLDEPPWQPPPSREEQLQALIVEFSADERKVWEECEVADKRHDEALRTFVSGWLALREKEQNSEEFDKLNIEAISEELEKACPSEIKELEEKRDKAWADLENTLSKVHTRRLEEILTAEELDYEANQPPRFDLQQIQRYILWRVFNLGWTVERFGHFDRFSTGYHGRAASKAERIGKKYQWIAYHEINAFISDHFQYREMFHEEDNQAYKGPWQDHLRDIDPSCTITSTCGGTGWDGHVPTWWGSTVYDAWGDPNNPRDWVLKYDDLPKVEDLLVVTNPADGTSWLNGQNYFNWQQHPPADREANEVERRELWYICTGYLVRADEAQLFLKWAEGVNFWGRWMPEAAEVYGMFLGEHAWSPAASHFQQPYYGDDGWTQPDHGCPVKIRTLNLEYVHETGGFDCSTDNGFKIQLPNNDLINGLGIQWSGLGADFMDGAGQIVTQDPTVHADGPATFLLRENALRDFLTRENLTICWSVIGEKRVLFPGFGAVPRHSALCMSGAYVLSEGRAVGFVKHMLDDPDNREQGESHSSFKVLGISRTTV